MEARFASASTSPEEVLIPLLAASLMGGLAGAFPAFADTSPYLHARAAVVDTGSNVIVRLWQETRRRP